MMVSEMGRLVREPWAYPLALRFVLICQLLWGWLQSESGERGSGPLFLPLWQGWANPLRHPSH